MFMHSPNFLQLLIFNLILKMIMPGEKIQTKMSIDCAIPFIENSIKHKLINSNRKQIRGCWDRLGGCCWTERGTEDKETLQDNGCVHCLDCENGFRYIHMSKPIILYTLNICSLFCVNYTSIKTFSESHHFAFRL